MFQVIQAKTPKDPDYPDRYYNLMLYKKILDGTLYDCFSHEYHEEYLGTDKNPKYCPEAERAPNITSGMNLMRSVVEQAVSFTFGENRFPTFQLEDEATKMWLNNIVKDCHLVQVFQDASTRGSIGSVAIHLKVLQNRFFPIVCDTVFLTPTFDPQALDVLQLVHEKKKVQGIDLRAQGYAIAEVDLQDWYWFQRQWDDQDETWFVPVKVTDTKRSTFKGFTVDPSRSVHHGLGLVPWIWVVNLALSDNGIDGKCTFEPAIENCIQIDYAMSRADRALKFNADPLLMIKTQHPTEMTSFVRTSENAIIVGPNGDAKILEVQGTAATMILDTVKELQDQAMQAIHGSRADPDKLATSNSSVAQRMLYLPTVQLSSHLRISYGDMGLVPLLKMMMQIASSIPIMVLGKIGKKPDKTQDIDLVWAEFFPPTPKDQFDAAQAMTMLVTAGIISKQTAAENMRKYLELGDIDDEMALIQQEIEVADQQEIKKTVAMQPPPAPRAGQNSK